MNHFKYLFFFFLSGIVFLTSCQKEIDPVLINNVDSTTIAGFKDSTLLIKSISKTLNDSATGAIYDSDTEYYYYDTLNKKTIISYEVILNPTQPYNGVELNYNSKGLLSHIVEKYIGGTDSSNISSIDYTYDAGNVVKTSSIELFNGQRFMISFNKIARPSGGYQLSWIDDFPYDENVFTGPQGASYIVNFNSNGKLLSYKYSYKGSTGVDSLIYDVSGNVAKVINTDLFYQTPPYTTPDSSSTYTWYDFVSRDTKGDQLYNLNRILYNGISEIPNSILRFGADYKLDGYIFQFSKFPALSTKISRSDQGVKNSYIANFNSVPQFDSKNRLTKYRLFFDDKQLDYGDWSITYYK